MLIGYCRVSTKDQNLKLQKDALKKEGCKKIYEDTIPGMIKNRPGLDAALEHVWKGDTLIVWKLDRLGYSFKGLMDLMQYFEKAEIHFKSLTDGIDTTTTMGRFFYTITVSLAQFKHELLVERTRAGLMAARKRGRVGGRKKKLTPTKYDAGKKLLDTGTSRKDVATSLEISLATLYRYFPGTEKRN